MKTAGTSIEVTLSPICGDNDVFSIVRPIEEGHKPRNNKGFFNPLPELIKGHRIPRKTLSEFYHRYKFGPHHSAAVIRDRIPKKIWNSYFKFCVERNPFDKVVSMYKMNQSNKKVKKEFAEWIQMDERLPYNYPLYTNKKKDILVDKIIYFENLNDQLIRMFRDLNVPFNGLTSNAKGNFRIGSDTYTNYYYDETKKVIEEKFKFELDLHGYKF